MDTSGRGDKAAFSAELIQRVVWITQADRRAGKLTRAQWAAIRFFGRATRYSRTLTAFADYHATSLGSASQTLKVLVEKGILARSGVENDSRSICFNLTREGRKLLEADPVTELVKAVSALPSSDLARLKALLETVHSSIVETRQCADLGVCGSCAHFKELLDQTIDAAVGFCSRAKGEICETDFHMLCAKYQQRLPDNLT